MAMTMNGEVHLPASREVVWEKLNDPSVLKKCIPGCEELTRSGENQFQAVRADRLLHFAARQFPWIRLQLPSELRFDCRRQAEVVAMRVKGTYFAK